jgi:hypothetical protein
MAFERDVHTANRTAGWPPAIDPATCHTADQQPGVNLSTIAAMNDQTKHLATYRGVKQNLTGYKCLKRMGLLNIANASI